MNQYPDVAGTLAAKTGLSPQTIIIILLVVGVWTIIWKGFALWRAARNQQKYWFLIMLILNDIGILEILYLLWFRKDKKSMMPQSQPAAPTDIA